MVNEFGDEGVGERLLVIDRPTVIDQLEIDKLLREKASILLASAALRSTVEVEPQKEDRMTLAEACIRASNGDVEALQMVRANVRTDYFERAYKSGHVSRVRIEQDDFGLIQHGQRLSDTYQNSIAYLNAPVLRERARVEAVNGVRNEYLARLGYLKDNISVTFSLVTRKVSQDEASQLGFFTDTMSLSAQLMTDDDGIVIDTAFIAGRDAATDEASDEEAVKHFLAGLGIDFSAFDADEMLEHPVLIPKSLIRDRFAFLERFEKSIEAVRGRKTFFGRTTYENSDYAKHIEACEKREKEMETETEATVRSLVVSSNQFLNPVDATRLLDRLNDALLKKRIIADKTIDASVLGTQAAYYVNHARFLAEQGVHLTQMTILQAKINKEGHSSSCPGGAQNKDGQDIQPWDMIFGNDNKNQVETTEEKLEDCDFISKECPKCGAKDVKTQCRKGVYYGACGCSSK